jgi:ribosomal protein S12 methylthiotransferase accessory factor
VTSEVDVPTFLAAILSPTVPDTAVYGRGHVDAHGSACHPDPETAANMSLVEAVQTVVGNVSGAREDLTLQARSLGRHERTRLRSREGLLFMRGVDTPKKPFEHVRGHSSRDARDDVEWVLARLRDAGCPDVLFADYSRPEVHPVRVVRVLVPGLETPSPFHSGPRARLALLRDLMPAP